MPSRDLTELLDEHCYITCTDHPSLLVATLHRKGRKHQQGAGISWGDVFMDMIPRDRRDAERTFGGELLGKLWAVRSRLLRRQPVTGQHRGHPDREVTWKFDLSGPVPVEVKP